MPIFGHEWFRLQRSKGAGGIDLLVSLFLLTYGLFLVAIAMKRVLLSHDAGWYELQSDRKFETVLPALKENGFTDEEIHLLTVENPKRAFAIGVRRHG